MILGEDGQKMSKSRGNVINPDHMVDQYGADSIRLYEMFMGPLEMTKPWSTQGAEGVYRFLARVWRLFVTEDGKLSPAILKREPTQAELKRLHTAIKKVTEDTENIRLNTAISAMMIFVNETIKDEDHAAAILEKFILILAPYAPHLAEEVWQLLGHKNSLAHETWPAFDPKYLIEDEIEMPVMIGGKLRAKVVVPKAMGEDGVKKMALADERVVKCLESVQVKKVIVVPGRVVNIVV